MIQSRRVRAAIALGIGCLGIAAAPVPLGTLTVQVGNVRNSTGIVHVDICPENQFLKDDCPYVGNAPAHAGITTVVIHNLPAGHYAAQIFHDENRNKKVDRALFGIPREGVGFSNDARISFGPPKWADAKFSFNGEAQTIGLKTRYFMGASGPAAR
ncbi:DUF2141 domain-containing protein [Sphingomonas oligophenolica]|uniref:DUF2141 domain-containing protein n=1 Tax=Sphingomonas oligophenolica TaxID=301154 RepID=A0ABU9YAJ7_9SPHN